ncbi:winged helix-turn-helix transcriptional regulator [Kitasatospora sp. NBC_00070]|uniref:winged helix-turn-helix transcriptional regulator n=1 Tax=Kitasatospora sp. NBC_00070 TaxID=2975962 RepID=UPI00324CB5C2
MNSAGANAAVPTWLRLISPSARYASGSSIQPERRSSCRCSLEEHGLLRRVVHAGIPPRVEYTLTELGLGLEPALRALGAGGAKTASAD